MDYLAEFLDYLRVERGLSPHTIAAYKKDVERFLLYFRGDILKTDPRTLSDFLKKERGENKEPATLARRISGLRRFFRFLLGEGLMKEDPTGNLRSPRLGLHLPDAAPAGHGQHHQHAGQRDYADRAHRGRSRLSPVTSQRPSRQTRSALRRPCAPPPVGALTAAV